MFALFASACEASLEPPATSPLVGTFASVPGADTLLIGIPVIPGQTEGTVGRIVADTMIFLANGTGRGISASIDRDISTNIESKGRRVRTFQHRRDGDRVVLDSIDCGENCVFALRPVFYTIRDDGLDWLGIVGLTRYERVSP